MGTNGSLQTRKNPLIHAMDAFDTSTEAGRMLRRLYGGSLHPNIEYPPVFSSGERQKKPCFIPAGAKLSAQDPRAQSTMKKKIKVPRRPAQDDTEIFAIDCIQRRKNKKAIEAVAAEAKMRTETYRPPAMPCYVAEKEKIQEKFQYGGGKALPDELTHPKGPLPSKLRQAARARKQKELPSKRNNTPCVATQLVETIVEEIKERQAYLERMRALNPRDAALDHIEREIAIRVHELEKAKIRLSNK